MMTIQKVFESEFDGHMRAKRGQTDDSRRDSDLQTAGLLRSEGAATPRHQQQWRRSLRERGQPQSTELTLSSGSRFAREIN